MEHTISIAPTLSNRERSRGEIGAERIPMGPCLARGTGGAGGLLGSGGRSKSRNVVAVQVVPERSMSEAPQTKRQAHREKRSENGESEP